MDKKTVFITGASRGVGLAIAKRFAVSGANIVIVAKTTTTHPKLKGTLWTAKIEIESVAQGGDVLAIPCDIRDLASLKNAIDTAGDKFGKIDVLVNNASSIYLLNTRTLPEKRFDLMHEVIVRANLFAVQYAIPFLEKSSFAHIINIAPKPDLRPKWFAEHTAYTLFKYSSSMLTMGFAAEFKNVYINALWPATLLATAAVENLLGGEASIQGSRKPEIMADAAFYLAQKQVTGKYYLDEELIIENNLDLADYSVVKGSKLITDLYVEDKTL